MSQVGWVIFYEIKCSESFSVTFYQKFLYHVISELIFLSIGQRPRNYLRCCCCYCWCFCSFPFASFPLWNKLKWKKFSMTRNQTRVLQLPSRALYPLSCGVKNSLFNLRMSKTMPPTSCQSGSSLNCLHDFFKNYITLLNFFNWRYPKTQNYELLCFDKFMLHRVQTMSDCTNYPIISFGFAQTILESRKNAAGYLLDQGTPPTAKGVPLDIF